MIEARLAFLSTYPVRGTTCVENRAMYIYAKFLSTYPVRGTTRLEKWRCEMLKISIHVPRAGYDAYMARSVTRCLSFLSTYPVRGTTHDVGRRGAGISDFYPRTPCGVRRYNGGTATNNSAISIHVPRAGYDWARAGATNSAGYFYPRTPCGVRLNAMKDSIARLQFLSTYPVRGTT